MDKGNTQRSLLDIITIQPSANIIDPSLNQNSQLIYSDEHSFLIKIQQKPDTTQTLKQPQNLRVKIIVQYDHNSPKTLKIQLTSDTEIYFNFIFQCNDWQFKRIKANQDFFIQFREYPDFIIKNFERLKSTDKYIGSFTIFSENQGKLDIIRHSQFKDDVIMQFDFVKATQEQIKKSIQYRYNLMRYQYQQYKNRYDNVCDTIKQKNPSLAIQIQKIHKK